MKIFLDVDGILCNFNKAATAIIEAKYPPTKWRWYEDTPNGFEKVNKGCTIDFWRNLEWMPDGKQILHEIENLCLYYKAQIYLLTTPMPNPGSGTGKLLWIKEHLPYYYDKTILIYAPKYLLAKPDHILIDDKHENVQEFIDVGGKAILVPRSWNIFRQMTDIVIESIKADLKVLLNGPSSHNR